MPKNIPTVVISFMGVDGSGKSSIIDALRKKVSKKYNKIKYLHLRPYLFLTDKRTVIKDPHNKKISNFKYFSLIKILMWLIIYKVFFLFYVRKNNQLIIFDRYAHDIIIDKIRYNFYLPNRLSSYILNLFPKPNLWIVLHASIVTVEKRKKELPTSELRRQMKKYITFAKKNKNSLLLSTEKSIKKNILLIINKISSI